MPCHNPKEFPRTPSIAQIIFSFWSFETSEGILRNQKIIVKIHFLTNVFVCPCIDYPFERCEINSFSLWPCCQVYKFTEEALLKLHKRSHKARFIANSSSCTTTELSKLLTSCLTAIKFHVKRYCETVYEPSNKNWFWSIKNSGEVLIKLKCKGFHATSNII